MFAIYRNPDTSECANEAPTLAQALLVTPSPGAAIVRNGYTMAESTDGLTWTLTVYAKEGNSP